jgi:hypothetical protein
VDTPGRRDGEPSLARDVRAHRAERPDHDVLSDPDVALDEGVLRDRSVGRDLASLDKRRLAALRLNENEHLGERRAGVGHLQDATAAELAGARAGRPDDDALAATRDELEAARLRLVENREIALPGQLRSLADFARRPHWRRH